MDVLFLIVPLALAFSFGAAVIFALAARRGQFDDPQGAAQLVFSDDGDA
jgi:cbb3-type cytochrome oxidase maturation protein